MKLGFLLAPAMLLLPGNTGADSAADELQGAGRDIYNEGLGRDPIAVRLGEGQWQPAKGRLTCRSCHGEVGEGGSEGGIAAPALQVLPGDRPRGTGWLADAVVRHRSGSRKELGDAMPLYRMSERDLAALSAYVDGLPNVPVSGMSPRMMTIGLNVAGASLTPDGRQRFAEAVDTLAASVKDEGGIYGRMIRFEVLDEPQAETADTLIRLAWTASIDSAPLTFVIQGKGERDAPCGSVDPTREQMTLAVADAIRTEGAIPTTIAGVSEPDSGPTEAGIILSRFDGWKDRALVPDRIYLSPELAAELAPRAGTKIYIVAPGDISQRAAAAQRLLDEGIGEPRDAMAIAVYLEAIDVVLEVLRTSGRRVRPYATCEAVKRLASARQKISVIHGQEVKTFAAFSNNGS